MQTSLRCAPGAAHPLGKRARLIVLALLLIFFAGSLFAAEIRGKVVGDRGEPLARVQISILENQRQTITRNDGSFEIAGLAPGSYTLQANAVGYWLINVTFSLAAGEQMKNFQLRTA